jgi:murein endopeptidase
MHSTASARIWLARARAATVTAMARRRVFLSFCAAWLLLAAASSSARAGGSRRSHRVATGESLWKIARTYRCTVEDLRRANHLGGDSLRPGQRLRIPACDGAGEDRRARRTALVMQRPARSLAGARSLRGSARSLRGSDRSLRGSDRSLPGPAGGPGAGEAGSAERVGAVDAVAAGAADARGVRGAVETGGQGSQPGGQGSQPGEAGWTDPGRADWSRPSPGGSPASARRDSAPAGAPGAGLARANAVDARASRGSSGDAVRDLEAAVRRLEAEVRRHERVRVEPRAGDPGATGSPADAASARDGAAMAMRVEPRLDPRARAREMRDRLPAETAPEERRPEERRPEERGPEERRPEDGGPEESRPAPRKMVAVAVPLRGQSFGRPQSGYLVSGVHMPSDQDAYYLRRPERAWGTTHTVQTLVRAIRQVRKRYPHVPPLSIGDLSLRHGGRISIHGSHQSGRDADIGFYFRDPPRGYPRAFAVATADNLNFGPTWALLSALCKTAGHPLGVERIFMTYSTQAIFYRLALRHRVPRAQLDEWFQYPHGRRADHGIIRHEPGHEEHFHVRFRCAPTDLECE